MPEWLQIVLGLGVAGVAVSSSLAWVRGVLRNRSLSTRLQTVETERRELQDRIRELDDRRIQLLATLQTAERERAEIVDASQLVTRSLRDATTTIEALETRLALGRGEIEAAQDRSEQIASERDRLTRELRGLRTQLSEIQVRDRRTRQLMQALGVPSGDAFHDPVAPDRRAHTRQTLQRLLVDTPSQAVALADTRGLLGFAVGEEAAAERLAVATGWIATVEAELSGVLCAPVGSASLMDRRFCDHLLAVPGTGWWLGLENQGEAPLFALRRAHLGLVGFPAPATAVPPLTDTLLDLDETQDELLSARLTDWARRWGADAVTVLDVDGRPRAATVAAQPSAVMALRRAMTPLFRRIERDGRGLSDFTLVARAPDGAVGTFRLAGTDLEAPFLAVVGPAELPSQALEELAGVVRWSQPASFESRVAS